MAELKPCPFCGGAAILVESQYRHGQESFYVKCLNKNCAVIPITYEHGEMESAIEAWNRRAEDD